MLSQSNQVKDCALVLARVLVATGLGRGGSPLYRENFYVVILLQLHTNCTQTFQPLLVCRYVFKLADFGTARELAPGETFFSLHGTEEYLYPGMYERALVNPQKKKDFSAKVRAALGQNWSD